MSEWTWLHGYAAVGAPALRVGLACLALFLHRRALARDKAWERGFEPAE